MTYHNAVKYFKSSPIESQNTPNDTTIIALWDALGAPQRSLKYLRLTGSNGKTVCAQMLLSVFRNSEYRVGALALPFVDDGRENIRINAMPLDIDEFTSYTEQVLTTFKQINDSDWQLSQSELLLTVALLAFRAHCCTFCLIESEPSLSDPTKRLPAPFAAAICGTIPEENHKEAQEIRSYISHGIQEIVSAPQNQSAYRLISETCAAINCRLTIPTKNELTIHRISLSGSEFSYKNNDYRLSLCGRFQITNATVVLEVLDMLSRRGYTLPSEHILEGLSDAKIPAKFEIISVSPTIIVDSTHSETAIFAISETLSDFVPLLGTKLRLCLPSGPLCDRYSEALEAGQYTVTDLITYDPSEKPKSIAKQSIESLEPDAVLLISGHYEHTSKIRAELLKLLSM